MMTCDWVREQLDSYELGCLEEAARQALEAHLASCERCRTALEGIRSADKTTRAALAWAEPPADFAQQVVRAARCGVLRRRIAGLAAVAAVLLLTLCAALLRGGRPPAQSEPDRAEGQLLAGEVYDAYGQPAQQRLVAGRTYAATNPTALSVDPGSLLVLANGSQFAPVADTARSGGARLSILAGSLVGQVGPRGREVAIELAPELGGAVVRTKDCEFYSSGFPPHRLAAGMSIPATALAQWPGEIRIHVYRGRLDLDLGTQKLSLASGDSAVIAGGVSAGTARALQARIAELRTAVGEATLAERELYANLCAGYARRILELRAIARAGDKSLPHLQERLELVEGLLADHGAALARIEAAHPQVWELDAAEAELRRLELLHEEADHALERYLTLLACAG